MELLVCVSIFDRTGRVDRVRFCRFCRGDDDKQCVARIHHSQADFLVHLQRRDEKDSETDYEQPEKDPRRDLQWVEWPLKSMRARRHFRSEMQPLANPIQKRRSGDPASFTRRLQ